jgi:hypothetical protein
MALPRRRNMPDAHRRVYDAWVLDDLRVLVMLVVVELIVVQAVSVVVDQLSPQECVLLFPTVSAVAQMVVLQQIKIKIIIIIQTMVMVDHHPQQQQQQQQQQREYAFPWAAAMAALVFGNAAAIVVAMVVLVDKYVFHWILAAAMVGMLKIKIILVVEP